MTNEDKLRDALQASAPQPGSSDSAWSQVGSRATALRRRRVLGAGVALLSVVALVLGVLAAAGTFDQSSSRSIVATPSPTGESSREGDVVASLDHSIVVMSSDDGHIVRTLTEGLNQGGGVSVAPDGGYVYYARGPRACDGNLPQGTGGLSRVLLTAGSPEDLVPGGMDPLVSPDGRWLAYAYFSCDAPEAQHIGVFDLQTDTPYWPLDGAGSQRAIPVAWSNDSQSLLYLDGDGHLFRIDGIPQPVAAPTRLAPGLPESISAATYTHDDSLLIARQRAQTFMVQHWDEVPGGIGIRFMTEGTSPSTMAFDGGDRLLLHSDDGTLSVQEGTGTETTWRSGQAYPTDPRVLRHDVHGASWIPNTAKPIAPSTTIPAGTTPTTTSTSGPTTSTTESSAPRPVLDGCTAMNASQSVIEGSSFAGHATTPIQAEVFADPARGASGPLAVLMRSAGSVQPTGDGNAGGKVPNAQVDGRDAYSTFDANTDSQLVIWDLSSGGTAQLFTKSLTEDETRTLAEQLDTGTTALPQNLTTIGTTDTASVGESTCVANGGTARITEIRGSQASRYSEAMFRSANDARRFDNGDATVVIEGFGGNFDIARATYHEATPQAWQALLR